MQRTDNPNIGSPQVSTSAIPKFSSELVSIMKRGTAQSGHIILQHSPFVSRRNMPSFGSSWRACCILISWDSIKKNLRRVALLRLIRFYLNYANLLTIA